eukprot:185756_1
METINIQCAEIEIMMVLGYKVAGTLQKYRQKYNTNNEFKLQVDNEKIEILDTFNTILTNGNYLWNPEGGIDNCLDCVTDATLQLWLPHKYKSQRDFEDNESKLRDCFKESTIDPLSVYSECNDNGFLKINTNHINKSHFQNNRKQSVLSQRNTDGEQKNLKGFGTKYDTEIDIVKFALQNNIQYSNHDDMISGWLVTRFLYDGNRIYHILIFHIIKYHFLLSDPQLGYIQSPRIVFGSLPELSQYRCDGIQLFRNNTNEQVKNINFIPYTSHIYLFPFASVLTIIDYPFRRLSSRVWKYSNSRYIADQLMDWHRKTHPNKSFEEHISDNIDTHGFNYYLFVMKMNALFYHPLTAALENNLKTVFENALLTIDINPSLMHFYNNNISLVDITMSYLLDSNMDVDINTFFGVVQMSFRMNTTYSSDLHIYRNTHKDNDICKYAQNITNKLTVPFREQCILRWNSIKRYNINNMTRSDKVKNM